MNYIQNRINRVFQKIGGEKVDSIFIKNSVVPRIDPSFFYFTGLESGVFEESIIIMFPDDGILFTSKLEEQSAKQCSGEFEIIIFEDSSDLENRLRDEGKKLRKIGINSKEITYSDYLYLRKILPEVEFFDISESISEIRLIKDEDEILRLKDAARLTCEVWESVLKRLEEGISEGEIKAEINYLLGTRSSTNAFDPIVAFAENSAEPHYLGSENRLRKGDFALFDFGARYRMYCADLTRTIFFGSASDKQKRMYQAVEEASRRGIESIRDGVSAKEIHNSVSKTISSKGFGGMFTHSTGHGIGLSVHEDIKINSSSNLILREDMVFTVEPGVYLPGYGGVRIEDDIIVRKNDCEVLTPVSKEFNVI
jgi:Xaa-Pro dipeptidase